MTMHNHNSTDSIRSAWRRAAAVCAVVCWLVCGGAGEAVHAQKASPASINPHWTGTNCRECHTQDNPKGKDAPLKFNGDPVKLCTRCHQAGLTCTSIHPVGVAPDEEMKKQFPRAWPLDRGRVNCLTCHDVHLQMAANIAGKQTNVKFIRGAPYETLTDFCFMCHKQEQYQKTNPHRQLDAKGNIIEGTCLFCHQTVPDSSRAQNIGDVTFKSELSTYCINCHAKQKTAHPANTDHNRRVSAAIKAALEKLPAEQGAYLPLDGDTVFCATCHNPHQKGVLKKKEAQRGAGEKYFVRLNRGYDLCVACHSDKRIETAGDVGSKRATPQLMRVTSTHKPVDENKCKMCHAVKPNKRDKPKATDLCFRAGCHKTELIEQPYTHNKAVLEQCYFCHRAHASVYLRLLTRNEERLCRGCHPHLRDTTGRLSKETSPPAAAPGKGSVSAASGIISGITPTAPSLLKKEAPPQKGGKDARNPATAAGKKDPHAKFIRFLAKSSIPRENRCGFCHNPNHRRELEKTDIAVCSECHMFVQGVISKQTGRLINVHQKFSSTRCSECHNPHSSSYDHLLKLDQPIERYYRRDFIDIKELEKIAPTPAEIGKGVPPPGPKQ